MEDEAKQRWYAPAYLRCLTPGKHLCCLYDSDEERREVVLPFLEQGLVENQRVIYIATETSGEDVFEALAEKGVSVGDYRESGQLIVQQARHAYLQNGIFDPEAMIETLHRQTEDAVAEGYDALRITGEMSWVLQEEPAAERFIEYEAKLNQFFAQHPAAGLCQYDRRLFDSSTLLNVLRTHPVVAVGKTVYDNFYYVPPDELLYDNAADNELNRWIVNLEDHRQREHRNHRLSTLLNVIRTINQSVVEGRNLPELGQRACEAMVNEKGYVGCGVVLLEEETGDSVLLGRAGELSFSGEWRFSPQKADLLPDCVNEVLTSGKTCFRTGWEPACGGCSYKDQHSTHQTAIVPMKKEEGERIVGWLHIELAGWVEVDRHEQEFLEEVAQDLCVARGSILSENELQRFREALDSSGDEIFLIDKARMQMIDVNKTACRELGFYREELLERGPEDINVQYSRGEVIRELDELARNPRQKRVIETVHRRKDGTEFPVEVVLRQWSTAEGQIVIACARDISERKRTEEELQHRLQFEELIARVSTEFINMGADAVDGGINDTLASVGRFFDIDHACVVQFHDDRRCMSVTHEWCDEAVSSHMEHVQNVAFRNGAWWLEKLQDFETIYIPRVAELGHDAEEEKRILEAQGIKSLVAIPMTHQRELVGFVALDAVRNEISWSTQTVALLQTLAEILVSALVRRRTETALQESEQNYRRIFELSPEAIVLLDADGTVLDMNERLKEWLGYAPEEAIGKDLWHLPYLPPESKDVITARFAERMRGENPEPYELAFVSRQGEKRIGLIHATPLIDAEGNVTGDLVLISDITSRKHAEQQLEWQRQSAIQSDRLRSLGEMASGIAHELNQPLVGVRGLAEHLLLAARRGWQMSEERNRQKLENIIDQADRMTQIIQHVRTFAREDGSDEVLAVNLNKAIEAALSFLGAQIENRGIKIEKDLDASLPYVSANPFTLEEVILNCMTNARDAVREKMENESDETSSLNITLQSYRLEDKDTGKIYGVLCVEDTGTGISPEKMGCVFDPFYTTKEPDQGIGLGLSIAKSSVEKFGGSIELNSQLEAGTTVKITLPAAQKESPNAE